VNIVILNWQRPLWEGDKEVVKGSGRDELMWVAIHMCMEAMLRISLHSYLYLKPAKTLSFLLFFMFSLQQNWIQEGGTGSAQKREWREGDQTMYTHMSKCKYDKIF
jgi:hypothetical protein